MLSFCCLVPTAEYEGFLLSSKGQKKAFNIFTMRKCDIISTKTVWLELYIKIDHLKYNNNNNNLLLSLFLLLLNLASVQKS